METVLTMSILWFTIAWLPFVLVSWPLLYTLFIADPGQRLWPLSAVVGACAIAVVIGGPASAAILRMAHALLIERYDVGWRDFFRFGWSHGLSGMKAVFSLGLALVVWAVDGWFLLTAPWAWLRWLLGLWMWVGVVLVMVGVWMLPVMVMERDGWRGALGRSVYLAVREPAMSAVYALAMILGAVLSLLLQIPLILLFGGFISFLTACVWKAVSAQMRMER